jgi:hypothetical protein
MSLRKSGIKSSKKNHKFKESNMIFLTVNGFSHRLSKDGQVLSQPLKRSTRTIGAYSISSDWVVMAPADMNLTSGDVATIRDQLVRLEHIFPHNYEPPRAAKFFNQENPENRSTLKTPDMDVVYDDPRYPGGKEVLKK